MNEAVPRWTELRNLFWGAALRCEFRSSGGKSASPSYPLSFFALRAEFSSMRFFQSWGIGRLSRVQETV